MEPDAATDAYGLLATHPEKVRVWPEVVPLSTDSREMAHQVANAVREAFPALEASSATPSNDAPGGRWEEARLGMERYLFLIGRLDGITHGLLWGISVRLGVDGSASYQASTSLEPHADDPGLPEAGLASSTGILGPAVASLMETGPGAVDVVVSLPDPGLDRDDFVRRAVLAMATIFRSSRWIEMASRREPS